MPSIHHRVDQAIQQIIPVQRLGRRNEKAEKRLADWQVWNQYKHQCAEKVGSARNMLSDRLKTSTGMRGRRARHWAPVAPMLKVAVSAMMAPRICQASDAEKASGAASNLTGTDLSRNSGVQPDVPSAL
jgi:hypothetical protein